MTENSSVRSLSQESRRRWDCDDKAYSEWTQEDLAEIPHEQRVYNLNYIIKKYIINH